MELGGALGTVRDKIFVATGSEVRGFTKKGKMFLQFETNLAEKIGSMYISGSHLFVCGNYVFNHYNDCRDANYLLASDRINDVLSLPIEKTKVMTPVLACADRSLRVVRDSEVRYTAELPGTPTTIIIIIISIIIIIRCGTLPSCRDLRPPCSCSTTMGARGGSRCCTEPLTARLV